MAIDVDLVMTDRPEAGSARHWSRFEERGVYLGLKSMLLTYRILGRRGFSLLLFPVMVYFFVVGRTARRASLDFLARVQSQPEGRQVIADPPGWRQAFQHFMSFGQAILDKLLAWTGGIRLEDVDFDGHEHFDALHEAKRGGVIIASHLGNAEVCRALGTRERNLKINVLVHTKHAQNFNRLLQTENAQATVSLLQTTDVGPETAILLSEKVDAGEFVVIVGDRTPVADLPRASWAPFLGRPAPFPQGPFVLAALLKCPVLLMFCVKDGQRFRIAFEPFSDGIAMPRSRRAEVLSDLVARYAKRLESYALKYPYQWFNLFDFWNQAERAANGEALAAPARDRKEARRR